VDVGKFHAAVKIGTDTGNNVVALHGFRFLGNVEFALCDGLDVTVKDVLRIPRRGRIPFGGIALVNQMGESCLPIRFVPFSDDARVKDFA